MFTLCQSPVASTASPALGKLYTKRKLFHRVRECLPGQISVCCNLELCLWWISVDADSYCCGG